VREYRSARTGSSTLLGVSVRPAWEHTFVSSTREAIQALHATGSTIPVIARELDLAPTTVSYHVDRLRQDQGVPRPQESASQKGTVGHSTTRLEVERMLALGLQRAEVARRLGVSKATVSYHARRLGRSIDERYARRYDWSAVQEYYDAGQSVRQCIQAFGFSAASWCDAVRRGAVVARPSATPIAELLVADTYRGRYNLKLRLLREGLKENRCERCGVSEWREEPLTMALHHVNGRRNDNRLENLQLLCPNCHSQTRNYAGRNGRGRRVSAGAGEETDAGGVPPGADLVLLPADFCSGALRSWRGRPRRRPDRRRGRGRRFPRSGAGGRAPDRRSDRPRAPPSRGRPGDRRS